MGFKICNPGGFGGKKAVREILTIDPEARVVVSSGYADNRVMANYAEYGFRSTIVKLYTMENLQRVLRQVLAKWNQFLIDFKKYWNYEIQGRIICQVALPGIYTKSYLSQRHQRAQGTKSIDVPSISPAVQKISTMPGGYPGRFLCRDAYNERV